jgi:hypothetical protein
MSHPGISKDHHGMNWNSIVQGMILRLGATHTKSRHLIGGETLSPATSGARCWLAHTFTFTISHKVFEKVTHVRTMRHDSCTTSNNPFLAALVKQQGHQACTRVFIVSTSNCRHAHLADAGGLQYCGTLHCIESIVQLTLQLACCPAAPWLPSANLLEGGCYIPTCSYEL